MGRGAGGGGRVFSGHWSGAAAPARETLFPLPLSLSQPCPSPLCFSNFSFCVTGITACRCGHCTRQTLTPSVLVGAARDMGARSGEAEGGERHPAPASFPSSELASPSFSLSAQA